MCSSDLPMLVMHDVVAGLEVLVVVRRTTRATRAPVGTTTTGEVLLGDQGETRVGHDRARMYGRRHDVHARRRQHLRRERIDDRRHAPFTREHVGDALCGAHTVGGDDDAVAVVS